MNNITEAMRNALKDNMTLADLQAILDHLAEEENSKNKTKQERKEMEDTLWAILDRKFDEDDWEPADIPVFAVLVLGKDHPEWTVEDMDNFAKRIAESVRVQEKLTGMTPKDAFKLLGDELDALFKKPIKKQEEQGKTSRPDWKDEFKVNAVSLDDDEAIKKFLEMLK